MHGCMCIFCGEYARIQTGFMSTMHAQVFTLNKCLCASAHTFACTLAIGCAYALMYVQFVHLPLGSEGRGVQLVYDGTCCLAWEVIFDRRKGRGVVCVFSIFIAGGSVCRCMCVYTHAHTHTHCTDGGTRL